VGNIVQLRLEEPVRLDQDQLEILVLQMGPQGADLLVSHAMEELAVILARLTRHHNDNALNEVRDEVKALLSIAQRVGMTTLARVGRDVIELLDSHDGAAYCAAMARLVRIGESSLVAVWDLQDMRI